MFTDREKWIQTGLLPLDMTAFGADLCFHHPAAYPASQRDDPARRAATEYHLAFMRNQYAAIRRTCARLQGNVANVSHPCANLPPAEG